MKIEIISGSPRGNSITYRVALHLQKALASFEGHTADIIDLRAIEMPQLQTVFTSEMEAPDNYKEVTRRMLAAEAFVLVTPEYNGSYSAALKNLVDHFPKQHHKAFGIVTASTGALGGVRAALQLQELVYALFGIGSPYMLVTPHVDKKFDETGQLVDESFRRPVDIFVREFLWLADRLAAKTTADL